MKKIKWGIIGCGDVTEIKSGPAFKLVDNSELVAVMRRNEEKAEDYARRHKVAKWYKDADQLINDPEVNAIYVATPPDTHAEYAIRSMQAGKVVYVEKPMALNYAETQKMLETSEQTNVPLFVAYYRRSLPGFLKVKELIEQGEIGQVRSITIQLFKSPSEDEIRGEPGWRVQPEKSGAGHFFDLASHQLDYLDFLLGPVKEVNSYVANHAGLYKAEDFVSAQFIFENNIVCTGLWNFGVSNANERDSIEIIGDKGMIRFSCFDFVPLVLQNEVGSKSFDFPKPAHVQLHHIKDVVNDLLAKGKSPSTGISASRTSWVLDEVVKDYYQSRIKS